MPKRKVTEKYNLFCDMDGVLVDFEGGVIVALNNKVREIADNLEKFQGKHGKYYKIAKKAVAEQDGDLDNGILGMPFSMDDIKLGGTKKRARDFMYSTVSNDFNFWADLPWVEGGQELWAYIKKYNPVIMSGPMSTGSKNGKLRWVKQNLGIGKDRLILTHAKHEYVEKNGKIGVLIDDMPKYYVPFRNAGGIAIQHTDVQTTIQELQKLGF